MVTNQIIHTHTADTSSYTHRHMFRVVHTHRNCDHQRHSTANGGHKHTYMYTDKPRGSYSDAEQGSPDGGPSVQSSVDDQDETLS